MKRQINSLFRWTTDGCRVDRALVALTLFLLCAGITVASLRKSFISALTQVTAKEEVKGTAMFLRPGALRRGGTYEVYLDADTESFNKTTVVETGTMNIVVSNIEVRDAKGVTITLAISAMEAAGVVPISVKTTQADAKVEVIKTEVKVLAFDEVGPEITFSNLPAGEKLISEGGFGHFELSLAGDGPFILEYGLRHKPFWASRQWNMAKRDYAKEQALTVEGPEEEAIEVALPEPINVVDFVAVDQNGRETYTSLVVESLAPLDLEKTKEVGLLESLFAPKVACADCSSSNPTFTFSGGGYCVGIGQCRDDDGRSPLEFTGSTCQGTECTSCCSSSSCTSSSDGLSSVTGGSGAGGYDRPDGYSPPTDMFRNLGIVYPHSGEFRYTVTDWSLPVPGLDFSITRTYRSQVKYHSLLGRNWEMNIFARYLRYGSFTGTTNVANGDMHFYGGNGRRDKYTWTGTAFTSPDGFFDKFVFNTTSFSQEIKHKDGTRYVFSETQVGPNVVRGKLSYIYGRNANNYLQFTYNISGQLTTITSSTGLSLSLVYSTGYLTRIYETQDTNNEVLYTQGSGTGYDGGICLPPA